MSNVYIVKAGNSIVSYHSGWEYRVFPMLKVPPACLKAIIAYIFECWSKCITFVENSNRNFVKVCRRNKVRTLTSQSELSKLLEELFVRSAGDPC